MEPQRVTEARAGEPAARDRLRVRAIGHVEQEEVARVGEQRGVQLRILDHLRKQIHPSIAWRTEVPLPIQGDRRAWDAVAIADDGWTGIEAISRLGVVDATLRSVNQKQRDDPRITRVVLAVADTVRNRQALRLAIASVRAEYPNSTAADGRRP